MRIQTNVKAGGIGTSGTRTNHNEKLSGRMTIKTGVKAGGKDLNHNEKMVGEDKTKSLKSLKTKLRLKKETIRELKDSDLKLATGGAASGQSCITCNIWC